jgi:hypothetical protein
VIKDRGVIEGRAPFSWFTACPPLIEKDTADWIVKTAQPIIERFRKEFDLPLGLVVVDTMIAGAGYRPGERLGRHPNGDEHAGKGRQEAQSLCARR